MDKIRAGFMSTGFFGYPKEVIDSRAQGAYEAVKGLGIETVWSDPVVEDPDIGRAVEQLRAGGDFDLLICCVTTWTEPPKILGVLREFRHRPVLLWGLGGYTEGDSLISPASQAGTTAIRSALEAMDFKFKYIWDPPDAPMSLQAVKDFAVVAKAVRKLATSRIGMLGYADMGLYTAMFDGAKLRDQIGVEVESFDMLEVEQGVERADNEEAARLVAQMRRDWTFEQETSDEDLTRLAKIYLALKEKIAERDYVAFSPKCVYGMSRYMGFTPCMALSMLGDEVHCVCECDAPGAISQTMLGYVSGQPTTFMEWYEFWPDRVLAGVCGFAPFSFVEGPITVKGHGWAGFTGLINTSQLKEGRVTLNRLITFNDDLRMHIVTGQAVRPRKWEELGWEPPAPRFPAWEIILDEPVEEFAQKVAGQHYGVTYGDHAEKLEDLCQLLDITVI